MASLLSSPPLFLSHQNPPKRRHERISNKSQFPSKSRPENNNSDAATSNIAVATSMLPMETPAKTLRGLNKPAKKSQDDLKEITSKVFFDVEISGKPAGVFRIH